MTIIKFQQDDSVILVLDKKNRWLTKISENDFHCSAGKLELRRIIGKEPGDYVKTNRGKKLLVLKPTMKDWIYTVKHKSQIIYDKDAAMIAFLADIRPGMLVYEAGTGSGALTSVLATLVGSTGKIITHEVREEAFNIAKENFAILGITNVEQHLTDVKMGFAEGKAEAFILDLLDPWDIIPITTQHIQKGSMIVIFLATFDQLERTKQSLRKSGYYDISCIELIQREIEIKEQATRPATRMIGHTGFLMSARYTGN